MIFKTLPNLLAENIFFEGFQKKMKFSNNFSRAENSTLIQKMLHWKIDFIISSLVFN